MSHGSCKCVCHKSVGIGIALIGLALLLGKLGILSSDVVDLIWPSVIIIIGLKKAFKGLCKCCSSEGKSDGHGEGCC